MHGQLCMQLGKASPSTHTRRGPAAKNVLLVKLQQLLDKRGSLQAQKAKK